MCGNIRKKYYIYIIDIPTFQYRATVYYFILKNTINICSNFKKLFSFVVSIIIFVIITLIVPIMK